MEKKSTRVVNKSQEKFYMSRKKIDLHLNFKEILRRIQTVKDEIYQEKKTGNKKWANLVGISESLVSQLHPKKPRKEIKEPSLEYVTAVARVTEKPYEWYLYGEKEPHSIHEPITYNKPEEHHCKFCGDMTDEIKALCKKVKEIMESGHTIAVKALESNIDAFEDSVKQAKEIEKLKETVLHHSKLLDPARVTGTGRAAGAVMRKKKM